MSFASLRKVRNYKEAKDALEASYLSLKDKSFDNYEPDDNDSIDLRKAFDLLLEMDLLFYNFNALKSYFEVSKAPLKFDEEQLIYDMTTFQNKIEKKIPIAELVSEIPTLAILRREFRENAKEGGKIAHQLLMSTADLTNLFEPDTHTKSDTQVSATTRPRAGTGPKKLRVRETLTAGPSKSKAPILPPSLSPNGPVLNLSHQPILLTTPSPPPPSTTSAPAQIPIPPPPVVAPTKSQNTGPAPTQSHQPIPPEAASKGPVAPPPSRQSNTTTTTTKITSASGAYESSFSKLDSWRHANVECLFQSFKAPYSGTDAEIIQNFKNRFNIDLSEPLIDYLSHHYGLRNMLFFKLTRLFDSMCPNKVVTHQEAEALVPKIKKALISNNFAVNDSFVREGISFRNLLFKTNNTTTEPYSNFLSLVVKYYLSQYGEEASSILKSNFSHAGPDGALDAAPSEVENVALSAAPRKTAPRDKSKFAASIASGLAGAGITDSTPDLTVRTPNGRNGDVTPKTKLQPKHINAPSYGNNDQLTTPITNIALGGLPSATPSQKLSYSSPIGPKAGTIMWTPNMLGALEQARKSVSNSATNKILAYSYFIKLKTGVVVPVEEIEKQLSIVQSVQSVQSPQIQNPPAEPARNESLTRGIKRRPSDDIVADIQKKIATEVMTKLTSHNRNQVSLSSRVNQIEGLIHQMQISEFPNTYYEDLFDNLPKSSFWKFEINKVLVSTVQYLSTPHPEQDPVTLQTAKNNLAKVILLRFIREENVTTSIDVILNRLIKLLDYDIFKKPATQLIHDYLPNESLAVKWNR